jgi:hypothetical protein
MWFDASWDVREARTDVRLEMEVEEVVDGE